MLIEAARRAEAAAKEMLALVNTGAAASAELREAMKVSKAFMAAGSAFQVAAAASIALGERHGDGGAEVLAEAAGLSRREAHSQVKTTEALRALPTVRDAVESGRVPAVNAKRLAETAEKTGADAVAADGDLLAKAESMRPEQFVREARRWVTDRDGDGGESEQRRQRARRCVRVWDGDDGTVHLRGEFDAVTGRRIGNRLRAEAARMHDADKKRTASGDERRTFQQCMADALDNLTSNVGANGKGSKFFADICVVAHVDDATGDLIAELPTVCDCPSRCSNNSRATPSSPASSTTPRADRYGEPSLCAAPPRPNASCSSPATADASPAKRTPTCAKPTTSDRCPRAGPPALTTWCWPAGTATPKSTTSTGRSTAHPGSAHCTRPATHCAMAPPSPLTHHRCSIRALTAIPGERQDPEASGRAHGHGPPPRPPCLLGLIRTSQPARRHPSGTGGCSPPPSEGSTKRAGWIARRAEPAPDAPTESPNRAAPQTQPPHRRHGATPRTRTRNPRTAPQVRSRLCNRLAEPQLARDPPDSPQQLDSTANCV